MKFQIGKVYVKLYGRKKLFLYHIYANDKLGEESEKFRAIKFKLQLYGAIAATISALFIVNSLFYLKIFTSMLAISYTWLSYIIHYESESKFKNQIK